MKRRGNLLHGTVRTATGFIVASALGATPAVAIPKVRISAPAETPKPATPKAEKPSKAAEKPAKPPKRDPAAAARLREEADTAQREGRAEDAARVYGQAYELDPSNVTIAEEYGRTLYSLSKYREAADLFEKIASKTEPAAFWNLGYARRKLRDYQGAADAYLSYVKLNPEDPDGYYALAECYRKLGREDDAVTAYDIYLKKETRPDEQAWVEKAKQKIEGIKSEQAARLQAQNTITMPGGGGGMIISMPGSTPEPVVTPAAPLVATPTVTPAPTEPTAALAPVVTMAAPEPAPVVVTVTPPPAAPVVLTPVPVVETPALTPPVAVVAEPAPTTPVTVAPEPATIVVETPPPAVTPAPVMTGMPRDPAAAIAKVKDGDRFFQQKQFPEAMSAYQEAVKLDDQNTNAMLKIGLVFANQNRFQDAIDTWEGVLRLDPANKHAPGYIAKAKTRLGTEPTPAAVATQPLQATVPVSTAAITVEAPAPVPTTPKVVTPDDETAAKEAYRRSAQLMREQKFSEAAAEASAALEKNPNYVNAYVARAGAQYSMKNYPAAIADYFTALTLNPDMATPVFGLARSYEKQGDTANACANYRKYASSTAADAQTALKDQAAKQAVALCGQ